jgi:hypothetical protein
MQPSQMSTTYFMASEGCVQLEDLVNQRFTVGLPSLLDPGSTFLGNQVASPHTWEASMIFFFFCCLWPHPKSICWNLVTNVMVLWNGAFGKRLGHEGISNFIREEKSLRRAALPLLKCEVTARKCHMWTRKTPNLLALWPWTLQNGEK